MASIDKKSAAGGQLVTSKINVVVHTFVNKRLIWHYMPVALCYMNEIKASHYVLNEQRDSEHYKHLKLPGLHCWFIAIAFLRIEKDQFENAIK